MIFRHRTQAGQQLAKALQHYKDRHNTIVIGLPRGGIVVAYEIAKALHLPLDVIIPRKLGAPGQPELAIGAIAEEEVLVNRELILHFGISEQTLREIIEKEKIEANRRLAAYRK